MIKICLFLFCVLFVVQTKGDCADIFLKCFSEFAESFFQNVTEIEHVNASVDNLPKDYKQVKNVETKTIIDITDAIQHELFKNLEKRVATDVIVTDNPNTQIYVKAFSYDFGNSLIHNLENLSFDSGDNQTEEVNEDQPSTGLETVGDRNVKNINEEFTTENRSKVPLNISSIMDNYNIEEELKATTEQEKDTIPFEFISTIGDRYNETPYETTPKADNEDVNIENLSPTAIQTTKSENYHEFMLGSRSIIPASIISFLIDSYITEEKLNTTIEKEENITKQQNLKDKAEGSTSIASRKQSIKLNNRTPNKNKPAQKTQVDSSSALTTVNPNQTVQIFTKIDPKTDISANKSNNNDEIVTKTNNNSEQKKSDDWLLAKTVKPVHNEQKLKDKQFEKDIRENLIQDDENNYDEDTTDYPQIDYIDLYKDTTNEENVYVPTDRPKDDKMNEEIVENVEEYRLEIETELDNDTSTNICHGNTSDVSNVYPWIATIFIKNDTANQFQYICDGALLSNKLLITAARCVNFFNSTVKPDDVLVFLGKRSLQTMGDDEKNVRISKIIVHANFSNGDGRVHNDLALLVLEEPVDFSDGIRPACVGGDRVGKSATTAWELSGALTPVFFENTNNKNCNELNEEHKTFCATYGNEVALCPSYGGVFAVKHGSRWYLHAIRSGDTADRGLCYTKDVLYTTLVDFQEWIMENME